MLKRYGVGTAFKDNLKKISCFFVALLLIVGSMNFSEVVTHADAGEKQSRVVRVGYYIAPGFQDLDEDTGVYSGSSYEYLMALKQYTGWEYEFVPVNFAEGVKMLQDGELDLMNNVSKTAEREQTLGFSEYASGANYGCLIVDANDTTHAYNEYSSFQTLKIGALENSIFLPYFEDFCKEHDITPHLSYYENDVAMSAALEAGEIDARIVSSSYQDGSRIVAKFAPMSYYFAVPIDEQSLLKELDDAMMDIQTDMPNFQQQMSDKYMTTYSEKNVVLSQAEKDFLSTNPMIDVAVSNAWYPISYFKQDGTYAGPLAEIYNEISQATGLEFHFIQYENYDAALSAVAAGSVDMIAECPYDFIFADERNIELTDHVNNVAVYQIVKDNKKTEDVKSIAVYGETYLEMQVKEMYGDTIRYVQYADAEAAVNAVLNGDVDCTFMNYYRSTSFQNKGKYISLRYILIPSLQYDFGLGIWDKADPALNSLLGKGLQTLDDTYIDSLFQMTVQESDAPDMQTLFYQNPTLFIAIVSTVAVLVVLSLSIFFYSKRMQKKNVELQRAKQAQTDFLSRMSHDMRTPMNGILGLSYLMEKETSLPAVKGYIPELQESSNYLLRLINDVLDMNKIESGNLTLIPRVCDEQKVFASILDLLQPLIEEKEIDFRFEKVNIEWQYMVLDEQRVKQIFINLLSNAIKFTPRGGRIDFTMELISQTDDTIRDKFVIRDTGIGISEEFLPHIFEPFQQENPAADGTKGTGLGLPIVKQLVELMDGNITVESQKGKGTEFTVYVNFPLAKEAEIQRAEKAEGASGTGQKLNRTGLRVLLCEDHPLNATIATKLLERQQAVVTWAKDGKIGLDMFEKSELGTFDLVLMDIRMPELDGLETTRAIRSLNREDAKAIPIIAMSANAYEEDIEKSLDAGMNAHLAKPVDPEKLYETINRFCIIHA